MQTENGFEIEDLVRTYGNDVLRTAYMYVKDLHIAEDIFQDVFIKVNNHLHTFQGNSSIKTWILRITINTCKDYIKSAYHRKMVPMEDFLEDSIVSESEFDAVEKEETIHTVKEAVMSLPEHYRSVILCVYYDELSMEETAKALDLPVGTVKSRLARAKEKLKELVEGRI